ITRGDFNADGRLDLVVANHNSQNIAVFLGNGDGTFASPVTYTVGNNPLSIAVGFFNNDTALDLAVANYGSGTVSVLLNKNDGTGGFVLDANYVTNAGGNQAYQVTVGDVNADGKDDLAVVTYNASRVTVFLNKADGSGDFLAGVNYATGTGSG